jgi:hypothetical protein
MVTVQLRLKNTVGYHAPVVVATVAVDYSIEVDLIVGAEAEVGVGVRAELANLPVQQQQLVSLV